MDNGFDKLWASLSTQEVNLGDPAGTIGRDSLKLSQPTRVLSESESALGPTKGPGGVLPRVHLADDDGDLRVVEVIGEGGMGKVELAVQRCLRREVALKTLRAGAAASDETALIQEALFTGYLEHPNIIPVHLLGQDEDGRPVLLMKRVSGIEWLELIADPEHPRWQDLPTDRLGFHLDVIKQVCNAVHFAHSRGILHRDIKPANIMIGEFGEVYLLDWGLALRIDEPRGESAPIVGTPGYFAPEMADVTLPLSVQTDVYLLGSTLHQVLTGKPRHTSGPDGMRSVVYSAYRSEPFSYGDDVPSELAKLCNQATHRFPDKRPASALAFRQRLEQFLQHRGSVQSCARAAAALAALREIIDDEGQRERGVALFTESRIGFEQALKDWPGNAAATRGLQAVLELRIDHELKQRNKGTAEELLLVLPEARPELNARLDVLRASLEEEALSGEQLRSMQLDLDVTTAGPPRAALFLLVGSLAGLGVLGAALAVKMGAIEMTRAVRIAYQIALPTVFGIGVFVFRHKLLRTTANKRLAACIALVLASPAIASTINHFIQPAVKTGALSSFLETLILITMAIAFDRRIAWIALVTAGIAVVCLAWPDHALIFQGGGTFLAFVVAAAVTLPKRSS